MTTIRAVNAPSISKEGADRLFNMTREVRLRSDCTLFDVGYEQAKRDFRDALAREIGIPTDRLIEVANDITSETPRAPRGIFKLWRPD